jgi:hypothetical protein
MFFLLSGDLKEKVLFIFKMVSHDNQKVSLKDLKRFYSMANYDPMRDILNEK